MSCRLACSPSTAHKRRGAPTASRADRPSNENGARGLPQGRPPRLFSQRPFGGGPVADAKTDNSGSAEPSAQKSIQKPDAEWRQELTPQQYRVLREKGTEPPFTR